MGLIPKQSMSVADSAKEMAELKAKNYLPVNAYVRHIVFWKDKDSGEELKIALPSVEFEKTAPSPNSYPDNA